MVENLALLLAGEVEKMARQVEKLARLWHVGRFIGMLARWHAKL